MKLLIFTINMFAVFFLVSGDIVYAAHVLEPLGTDIAATPPRGRMFGQIEDVYSRDEPDDWREIKSHNIGLDFE